MHDQNSGCDKCQRQQNQTGLQAANTTIRRLAIFGFGDAQNNDGEANIRVGEVSGTVIEECFIGTSAASFTTPAETDTADNIRAQRGGSGTIRNNLIGYSGGNGMLNFPVIETADISGSGLTLTGFARPGSVIEFFIAAADPSGFGEGKTYLVTQTEGSGDDSDTTSGTYGPGPVNGIVQGEDTTNRFEFLIPVPVGVSVGTVLTATATLAGSTSEFSGNKTVTGILVPDILVLKSAQTFSDPINGTTNPKAIPGASVIYTIGVTNQGGGSADTDTTMITDAVPVNTSLFVGNLDGSGSPVQFIDGVTASGLNYTFTSLASTTDDVEFSNNDGASYTYNPGPDADADGFNSSVTHLRLKLKGAFNGASGGNNPSFEIKFKVRVE